MCLFPLEFEIYKASNAIYGVHHYVLSTERLAHTRCSVAHIRCSVNTYWKNEPEYIPSCGGSAILLYLELQSKFTLSLEISFSFNENPWLICKKKMF